MHWCPYCGKPCYCDGDDTDLGDSLCKFHDGETCLRDIDEDEELEESEE